LKRILLACVALAALVVPVSVAGADPVQEFTFQLKDIKPDGRFTVVFTSRTYDTSGGIPPKLLTTTLRLPAGAKFRREFLKKYACNVKKLNETKSPKTCAKSEVGRGTVLVDARPFLNDPIPANIYMYLAKGSQKGAVFSFAILGIPDQRAEVVRTIPVVRDTKVVVQTNFFNEPTPDGKFGYKLVIPNNAVQGVNISIAEVRVTTKGLTLTKKKTSCAKKRGGKCVKKKVKRSKLFWFNQPPCPPSGQISFASEYDYESVADVVKTVTLPCPNFRR
jgi:hypothetical protein